MAYQLYEVVVNDDLEYLAFPVVGDVAITPAGPRGFFEECGRFLDHVIPAAWIDAGMKALKADAKARFEFTNELIEIEKENRKAEVVAERNEYLAARESEAAEPKKRGKKKPVVDPEDDAPTA
jgi:hypothetical protein